MGLDQIGIALSGVIAVWLSQDERESWRRWACIFGMLGQPFWFYATWKAEQWGIFALCTLYTYAWARGVWTHWLSPYFSARTRSDVPRARNDSFGLARHLGGSTAMLWHLRDRHGPADR
jgi:hypothetical protein